MDKGNGTGESVASCKRWLLATGLVLVVAHHDFWLWDDRSLVFGFLPVGLVYHMVYSIAAAVFWAACIRWAWPVAWEQWASEPTPPPKERP